MTDILKKHYLAIILALIIGVMNFAPQFYAIKTEKDFKGIYQVVNSDEEYYLARAKEIVDGYIFLSNPYLYEYKNGAPTQFWLPDFFLARPLGFLNVEVQQGYLFYDLFFTALLICLSYSIIYTLTGGIYFSLFGAIFLHIGLFFKIFNRSPNPQFTFIFWLLLFLLWLKFLERPTIARAVLAGVTFGLLLHIYPYFWSFYVIWFVLFLILNLFLKNHLPLKKYLLVFLIALVVAIPYFFFLFKSMALPYYQESLTRLGLIFTHFPSGIKLVSWGIIITALFALLYKRKIIDFQPKNLLLFSGVLAGPIATNQHLITGMNLEFSSHYWLPSVFAFTFAVFYLLYIITLRLKFKYIKFVLIFGGLCVLAFSSSNAAKVIKTQIKFSEEEKYSQNYAPLFAWLRNNTNKDDVVYGVSDAAVIYTENNIFYSRSANMSFVPDEEVEERFILSNFWENFDRDFVLRNEGSLWGTRYMSDYNHNQSKNKLRQSFFLSPKEYIRLPEEKIQKIIAKSKQMQNISFEKQLKKYRVDYFLWDKNKNPNWRVEEQKFLKKITEFNNIAIYKVTLSD